MSLLPVPDGAWQPGLPVTWGPTPRRWPWGGRAVPCRASRWGFGRVLLTDGARGASGMGLAPGRALGKHRGSSWTGRLGCRAVVLGWSLPCEGCGVRAGQGLGGPERGLAWPQHGGSGEERGGRGCRHCHCHCRSRLAALWPPSLGMLGTPLPSGVRYELRGWRGVLELAVGQHRAPCTGAWQRFLCEVSPAALRALPPHLGF